MTLENFWFEAILIIALIFANGFFASAEIAVIVMRKSRIDALLEKGVRSAAAVARLKNDPDRFLATVQIGVTVISSLASAIGGAAAIGFLKPQIAEIPIPLIARWAEAIALLIVVLPISYLSLVLGELVPKSLALRFSERIACFVARPIELLARVSANGKTKAELEQLAKRFGGKLADATDRSVVIEASGDTKMLDQLVEQLRPHGITKLVRTGRVALEK